MSFFFDKLFFILGQILCPSHIESWRRDYVENSSRSQKHRKRNWVMFSDFPVSCIFRSCDSPSVACHCSSSAPFLYDGDYGGGQHPTRQQLGCRRCRDDAFHVRPTRMQLISNGWCAPRCITLAPPLSQRSHFRSIKLALQFARETDGQTDRQTAAANRSRHNSHGLLRNKTPK